MIGKSLTGFGLRGYVRAHSQYGMQFVLRTKEREDVTIGEPVLPTSMFDVRGEVFLITGATGVLGSSLSRGLAELGASVLIGGRDLARAEGLAKELTDRHLEATAVRLDLGDDASIDEAVRLGVERYGRIDCLVNNAITHIPGNVESYSVPDWESSMRIDATGFFRVTQQCLKVMLSQHRGNIINISSVLGSVGPDPRLYPQGLDGMRPHYFFVKAGVVGFMRFLAVTYARQGIRVNAISPGGFAPDDGSSANEAFAGQVPMGRLASPKEFLGAVVFLASPAASYVTGHNLVVDGGYSAW